MTGCTIPPGGFKGWTRGTLGQFTPRVSSNCSKIFAGDQEEIARVKQTLSNWTNALSDQDVLKKIQNCSWLREDFTDNLYNTKFERNFSIAFTFVVYHSPQQVLRLLRLLYRPQNVYCIHYDTKSKYGEFFESIANCFNNVMIASKRENVVWGHYSILQAQMNCISDLLHYRRTHIGENPWRYVINVCGKELPLVTTREIVKKLMKLNGVSSIITEASAKKKNMIKHRLQHPVFLNENKTGLLLDMTNTLGPPPFDMALYHKSSSYNALSFQFAHHITFNQTAIDVIERLEKVTILELPRRIGPKRTLFKKGNPPSARGGRCMRCVSLPLVTCRR